MMTETRRNELALAHEGIVRQQARRLMAHAPRRYEERDLASWGFLAMLRALDQYDGRRGQLGAYLAKKIEFGIYDGLREAEHSRRQVQPQFAALYEAEEVTGQEACPTREILLRECWEAIGKLPERWQMVLRLYYLSHRKMRQIGLVLGVNESRVSQIHAAAMRKLRGMLAA